MRDVKAMEFDLQPVLESELVHLRPLRTEDFEALYKVASDPGVWEQHPEPERAEERVFRQFFRIAMESGGAFAVIDRVTGAIIGSSRYHHYKPEAREIEIGFTFLSRSHWGGRYNGEMKRLMLDHAFHFVDSVVFVVAQYNYRSQRAVEKIGGVREQMIERYGRPNIRFRIGREDWQTRVRGKGAEAAPTAGRGISSSFGVCTGRSGSSKRRLCRDPFE